MSTDSVQTAVTALLAADPSCADRDEVAVIVRRSREVRSWLESVDVQCARRTRELAAAGQSEPAESMLDDEGHRTTKDATIINTRSHACDAMPAFEAALAAGQISGGHVDAVANVLKWLDDELRAAFISYEAQLLAAAKRERIVEFERSSREFAVWLRAERDRDAGIDTAEAEAERMREAANIKQWLDKATGMHHIHAELDPERAARVKKALRVHLRRVRKRDGNSGRSWSQLEVDAFMQAIDSGVTRKPVSASSDDGDCRSSDDGDCGSSDDGDCGSSHAGDCGSSHAGDCGSSDAGDCGSSDAGDCGSSDAGDCGSSGGRLPGTFRPDTGRRKSGPTGPTATEDELVAFEPSAEMRVPDITILVDHHTVHHGPHDNSVCETSDGIPLPIDTVRRFCCDAEITLASLDENGMVRNLGRTQRTPNRAQRRQLQAMHRTCAGHGCEVSFDDCQIHHVIFWRNLGETNIDNLIPLCSRHHHLAHEGGWTLTMTPDRIITWTRPDGTIHWHGSSIDRAPNGVRPTLTTPSSSPRDPNRLIA